MEQTKMRTIEVIVDFVRFENRENHFQVLAVHSEEEELTAVGKFYGSMQGLTLSLTGCDEYKQGHGWQFSVKEYEIIPPSDEESILRYLSSGVISGVKETLAGRIVKKFGAETMRIIEEEPERLAEVKGISERKAQDIAVQVEEKKETQSAMMFLQKYGIGNTLAVKLFDHYGARIYRIIRENPYQMAEEVDGVGFVTADEIARRSGISVDSGYRIRCGILYELTRSLSEGHTYLPREVLIERSSGLLGVPAESVTEQVSGLMIDRKLVCRNDRVYSTAANAAENNVAIMLLRLAENHMRADYDKVEAKIADIEREGEITLDELQRQAVHSCVENGVFLLTGGPGTGKTTTINTIIQYFLREGLLLSLAAPTGRAAKRMTEATGYEAKTIHRLLGVGNMSDGEHAYFDHDEENLLEADVIIIDEMSMVDIFLFQSLLKAIEEGTRLILVGDMNQLPSVGPGQVLRDLAESHIFAGQELQRIFRQAESSDIVVNAHRIREGKELKVDNENGHDFFFLERDNVPLLYNNIVKLVTDKMPRFVNVDPIDVQVLCPMKKGELGVETLNGLLQKYVNPQSEKKREYWFGSKLLREGDKVMQTKNNYELEWEVLGGYNIPIDKGCGIFNGDIGRIIEIREHVRSLKIEFDDCRIVEYPFDQVEDLELAYAITIHKSQGSEYPAVLIPLWDVPRLLSYRNLLYTGVTRGRQCVTLLGQPQIVREMIQNENKQKRYSGLKERLLEMHQTFISA